MILVFFLFTLLLSLSFFGPMVSYLILYKKTQNTLRFKRRHSEFEWTKATQQLTLSPIGVADSGYFPLDHSSTNTADANTPSLSLHDVDSLRVRISRHSSHPRRFVFGKFVRKPNCSWSEAFVNRGLTVHPPFTSALYSLHLRCRWLHGAESFRDNIAPYLVKKCPLFCPQPSTISTTLSQLQKGSG